VRPATVRAARLRRCAKWRLDTPAGAHRQMTVAAPIRGAPKIIFAALDAGMRASWKNHLPSQPHVDMQLIERAGYFQYPARISILFCTSGSNRPRGCCLVGPFASERTKPTFPGCAGRASSLRETS